MTSRNGANPAGAAAVAVGHCTESIGADGNITPVPAAQEQELKLMNFICLWRVQQPWLVGSAARVVTAAAGSCLPCMEGEWELCLLVMSGWHRAAFPCPSMGRTVLICSDLPSFSSLQQSPNPHENKLLPQESFPS